MRRPTPLPAFALAAVVSIVATAPAAAQRLVLSTENDLFVESDEDDLYTFSIAIGAELGRWSLTLRENAFTDRAAGTRFDETYLSIGRPLETAGPWNAAVEAGLARRGHGLFGESVQNAVHRAIGADEVHLDYLDDGYHLRLAFQADRRFELSERWSWGPRFEADVAPGLRSLALVAAEATWRPARRWSVELLAGARATETSYAPLEPHLEPFAPAARVGVVLDDRFFVSWSYNDLGDAREHLATGYRVPLGLERER